MGRLSVINDEHCDAELPSIQDSSSVPTEGENNLGFHYLSSFIALAQCLARISRSLFHKDASNVAVNDLLRRVAAADDDLETWRRSLPQDVRPGNIITVSEDDTFVGSTLLGCIYYNAVLNVHRASLASATSSNLSVTSHRATRMRGSGTLCLAAARSIIRLMNTMADDNRFEKLRLVNLPFN